MTFWSVTQNFIISFGQNCIIFAATLLGAIPLGLLITFCSMSKFPPLRYFTKLFVWVIRGTPMLLQLYVVMYVPGIAFDIQIKSRMTAALIAFIINYAAYFSEIFRGGIESIAKGQYEAGQVLGMTKSQIFFKVVLFQVVKRIIPPMGNEIITLVKDTSLARVISIPEVISSAVNYSAMGYIWPLFYTGVYFLVFVGVLTVVFAKVEKKLNYYSG